MTKQEAETVARFVESGGLVRVRGPFVDGFASVRNFGMGWQLSSDVLTDQPLTGLSLDELSFFRRVDYANLCQPLTKG